MNAKMLIAVVLIVLTVIGGALMSFGGQLFWFPEQASTVAPISDLVFHFITWVSIFFFVLITALTIWFAARYNTGGKTKAESSTTHNTPLELAWTIIPLILVIAMFYVGMEGYLDMRRPPAGSYEVNVTAQRWSWTFSHRNGCTESELWVPVNRPVRLIMSSQDVLHALFIPAFRVKQDIVPGRLIDLWFQATEVGDYDLYCAEYCGKDHSQMVTRVHVVTEDELEAHLQECADWAKNMPDEHLYVGAAQRIYGRCSSCHSLDGRDGTGPTWRGLWVDGKVRDRVFTDGSELPNLVGPGKMFETYEDYLRQSILNPQQKIVMNFTGAMPTFRGQLKERELLGIIDFMKRLEEFDEKGKPKPGTPAAEIAAAMANAPPG